MPESDPTPLDPIAQYYRDKQAAQDKEREEHLAAGKSIHTFKPTHLVD